MNKNKKTKIRHILYHVLITLFGLIMIYPLIWLFFATFKTNKEIFGSISLFPENYDLSGYINGWHSTGQYTFVDYFRNTFLLVVPTVIFTLISCPIVAYGFARFEFPGKKVFFSIMISTLMLPNTVIIIPRYILFRDLGWLDSYLPFWVPALFACFPFFIFMMVQFLRGIPKELDEAAFLDGCNSLMLFLRIHIPLLKPALISASIFQFIWTWNDFFNPLIYISSVKKYPLSLALRLGLDVAAVSNWNEILAMALVSIIPLVLLFFFMQKYFVEGIITTGLKT
ncbi:MAG: carbohydrate ABC transporter permease [Firmicutes bacterium]|nr:carbohydrate ABC transporter permease [Bacillota bacterium]